jgi:uncharacterized damage-inducible protein DinB
MAARKPKPPVDLARAVLECWRTHERINQFLLDALPPESWDAKPPSGKGRTIAAIVSHVHNVRHMWLVVSAKEHAAPPKLERATVTLAEAKKALAASARAIDGLLERALADGGHVKDFKPDVVGMLGYMVSHEAHHRGQICMQARALGHQLPMEVGFGMWEWTKRWKETQR